MGVKDLAIELDEVFDDICDELELNYNRNISYEQKVEVLDTMNLDYSRNKERYKEIRKKVLPLIYHKPSEYKIR